MPLVLCFTKFLQLTSDYNSINLVSHGIRKQNSISAIWLDAMVLPLATGCCKNFEKHSNSFSFLRYKFLILGWRRAICHLPMYNIMDRWVRACKPGYWAISIHVCILVHAHVKHVRVCVPYIQVCILCLSLAVSKLFTHPIQWDKQLYKLVCK